MATGANSGETLKKRISKICAEKFALYLYKNNHLDAQYCIRRKKAQEVFKSFKRDFQTRLSFWETLLYSKRLLKRTKDRSVIVYSKDKLLALDEAQIVKKILVVCHSCSFNKPQKSQEACKLCDVRFDDLGAHLEQEQHRILANINSNLLIPQFYDFEITVDGSPTLSNIIARRNVPKRCNLILRNLAMCPIIVISVYIANRNAQVDFNPVCPVPIQPFGFVQWTIGLNFTRDEVLRYPLLITTTLKQIAVELVFHVHNEFFDDLHPTEPYRRAPRPVAAESIQTVEYGVRPFRPIQLAIPLGVYALPDHVAFFLNVGLMPLRRMSKQKVQLFNKIQNLLITLRLTRFNYSRFLHLMLFIEEHQQLKAIREFDRDNQTLRRVGQFYELEVTGLAEGRPSLVLSDSVYVRESREATTVFEGVVHQVQQNSVLLQFGDRFSSVYEPHKTFFVNFTFNRNPLRVQHQAVRIAHRQNIVQLLFPLRRPRTIISHLDLRWFNPSIATNPEQRQAILSILHKSSKPAPYLIFGPPGTGKTVTLVECVKQIYSTTSENVLICTPCNSAANEVTRRLIDLVSPCDMLRCLAPSFSHTGIPGEILAWCNYTGGHCYQPDYDQFTSKRIVITTLTFAARLVNCGVRRGHFGFVFVDEAGQATESETLIAISGILSAPGRLRGQVVLAGDPKQLGPVVQSPIARNYHFDVSMLERLMNTKVYQKNAQGMYEPRLLTKLLKNYRSHAAIIQQSNVLFYDNELQSCGRDVDLAIGWRFLPNPTFPLIFHSVFGVDQREGNSPSFFNILEIQLVLDYLGELLGSRLRSIKIESKHIGVVTPYKKQAEKIRQACLKRGFSEDLLVGTVEQVQGQERMIIIISTVRSQGSFLAFDRTYNLGFIDNPKRFNVAVTRAKALLIVIGNPIVLRNDNNWRSLMEYCRVNGAFVGDG